MENTKGNHRSHSFDETIINNFREEGYESLNLEDRKNRESEGECVTYCRNPVLEEESESESESEEEYYNYFNHHRDRKKFVYDNKISLEIGSNRKQNREERVVNFFNKGNLMNIKIIYEMDSIDDYIRLNKNKNKCYFLYKSDYYSHYLPVYFERREEKNNKNKKVETKEYFFMADSLIDVSVPSDIVAMDNKNNFNRTIFSTNLQIQTSKIGCIEYSCQVLRDIKYNKLVSLKKDKTIIDFCKNSNSFFIKDTYILDEKASEDILYRYIQNNKIIVKSNYNFREGYEYYRNEINKEHKSKRKSCSF